MTTTTRCASVAAHHLILLATFASAVEVPATITDYFYGGRQVTASWIDQQYGYFKDKIACVDGKFFDIGRGLAQITLARRFPFDNPVPFVTQKPPEIGEVLLSGPVPTSTSPDPRTFRDGATVLQVVGKNEAIIQNGRVFFHVRGIDTAKQIDGTRFQEIPLVYVGTYQYVDTTRAGRTIQSFIIYQPLARQQFAAALAGGFKLVRYKIVIKKVPQRGRGPTGDAGVRFLYPGTPKVVMVDKGEIVGWPVPVPAGSPAPDESQPTD